MKTHPVDLLIVGFFFWLAAMFVVAQWLSPPTEPPPTTKAICPGQMTLEPHPDPDLATGALILAKCPAGWRRVEL